MPSGAHSRAIARVNACMPALAAEYIETLGDGMNPPADSTLITDACSLVGEVGQRVLQEEHRAAEVHRERLVPRFGRELPEGLGQRVGGVVHDDVDAAEAVDGRVDERLQRVELAHVGGDADRLAAHGLQELLGLGAGVGLAARDRDLGAGRDEALGDRAPDAARAAGDDRDARP